MTPVLCIDVGSTFTKAVLADADSGELLASAAHRTTIPEVLDGVRAVRDQVVAEVSGRFAAAVASDIGHDPERLLVCSSAGGGLRLAVVGYERLVTAEAGRRVALSAGGRVVHLAAGPLDAAGVEALRASRPDLIVLVGGTNGGNADVVVHNARRIGIARLAAAVVLAANVEAAPHAAQELTGRGRKVSVTANVLPRIGELDPLPARSAIRAAFLTHVIGGKGLSRASSRLAGRTFAQLVRAPTPDAVLTGAGLLGPAEDVLLVDVGGATTDVYSVLEPDRVGAGLATSNQATSNQATSNQAVTTRPVVEPLWHARTVEGDLGMRWSAPGVVQAAVAEGLLAGGRATELAAYAERVAADPGHLPVHESPDDVDLARLAALTAVRRHGRPQRPGEPPRPLREVSWVIGSGGVLRHGSDAVRAAVLTPLVADHGGGWAGPDQARLAVDAGSTLFAAGLLADSAPDAARRLARAGLSTL